MYFSIKNRLMTFTNNYKLDLLVNQRKFPIINKKEKEIDMYHKIKDFNPEMIDVFNVESNIIIASPTKHNYLKRDSFGNLNINIDRKIDVSNCQVINGYAILHFFPKIKIITPKGINLNFEIPYETKYIWNYYQDHTILHRHSIDNVIPDYHIYKQLIFILYIDIKRIKTVKNVLTINKGESLISMNFTPKYFVGSPGFTNIDNVYFIQNDEFVQTLEDLY